ncbi:MAG: damage-inducible protein CinA [Alphaproteobacteria bacterium CG11_big_fil_rev_8_21_14_0_20_44_7]|nr:MAG: damage-inducible protein CinA [Alphaproteobacteria bacterium CG11_big_fil_rev_8_21_14_0_20_44_7]
MINASVLLDKLRAQNLKLASAESCTGGMIAAALTDIAGSSDVFERGFVTYSNESKIDMLGVSRETLEKFGAVSEQVAGEMALGALKNSQADIAIAVTGIAGPSGGSKEKPIGLVYIAVARGNILKTTKNQISGNRRQVRKATLEKALQLADLLI